MRFNYQEEAQHDAGIDMTPIIDIVFIMLIFFVLTASFNQQQTIKVDRPSTVVSDGAAKDTLIISIDASGMVWFENRSASKAEIAALVRSASAGKRVSAVVNADRRVESGLLIEVVDQVRIAGVSNVAVATEAVGR